MFGWIHPEASGKLKLFLSILVMLAVYLPWEIISNYFQFRIQAIQAVPENMDRGLSYLRQQLPQDKNASAQTQQSLHSHCITVLFLCKGWCAASVESFTLVTHSLQLTEWSKMVKVPNSRKLAETFASSAMGCCVDVALRRK